jgi:hypothetical protein
MAKRSAPTRSQSHSTPNIRTAPYSAKGSGGRLGSGGRTTPAAQSVKLARSTKNPSGGTHSTKTSAYLTGRKYPRV